MRLALSILLMLLLHLWGCGDPTARTSAADVGPNNDLPYDFPEDADPEDSIRFQGCAVLCTHSTTCTNPPEPAEDWKSCVESCVDSAVGEGCAEAMVTFAICFSEMSCEDIALGRPDSPDRACYAEYGPFEEACLAVMPTLTCQTLDTIGEPCVWNSCPAGTFCEDSSALCTAAPGVGEACGGGTVCAEGLGCDFATTLCAPMPGAGAPCALGTYGPSLCSEGLGCVEGACGPLPGDGEACTNDNRCAGALGCDFTTTGSFCAPKRAAGGACENDQICEAGLYCEFSVLKCTPYLAFGETCNDGNECGPQGSCLPVTPSHFACAPMPGLGEACFLECGEGYCAP